jgi:hypothetical protein
MNTEEKIAQLERQVAELLAWKAEKTRKQLTYPLDKESIDILGKYFIRIVGQYVYYGGVGGKAFLIYEGKQDDIRLELPYSTFVEYVANPTTDFIAILNPNLKSRTYLNDEQIAFYTTDTTPGGLTGNGLTNYYIVSATADGLSFKVSATLGGAAINLTSSGTGRQFLDRF